MKIILISLFLVFGSKIAVAQSDAKLASGGPGPKTITIYGTPAIITNYPGMIHVSCGRNEGICYSFSASGLGIDEKLNSPSKTTLIQVYLNGDNNPPVEIEASEISTQQINGKTVLKIKKEE